METTWILVAHRSGARIYERNLRSKRLALVSEISNPDGRKKDFELSGGQPGRAFDSKGRGRHSMSQQNPPTVQVAKTFAGHLASLLNDGRNSKRFSRIALVAEPKFLGRIEAKLSPPTKRLVCIRVEKDLAWMLDRDIQNYLNDPTRSPR